MNHAQFWGGGGAAPYQIEQSLRFDGSSQLTRTNSNDGSARSFTLSYWIKKTYQGPNNNMIIGSNDGGSNWAYITYGESSGDDDQLIGRSSGSGSGYSNGYVFNATRKHRDPSAWQHHFLVVDKTAGTSKGYINGVLDDGGTYGGTRSSNGWTFNGTSAVVRIGVEPQNGTSSYLNGYLAEFYFVDGTAMDETDFGEFDDNGVWRPIEPTISSYGTNGYYLKFDPSATNGVGHDHSGNGNNWTPSGFDTTNSTASTYDVMSDTPTTNWCTLNPLDKGEFGAGITLSEGNLRCVSTSSDRHVRSTFFLPTSGKWYFEATATTVNSASYLAIGLYHSTGSLTSTAIATAQGRWYAANGYGNGSSWGATYDDGDIIGIAVDMDSGKIWAAKNNTWQASGDPAAGTNPMYSDLLTAYSPDGWSPVCANWQNGNTADFNFGQRAFEYTPPTGFKALNTKNLPAPTIKQGSDYFAPIVGPGDTETAWSETNTAVSVSGGQLTDYDGLANTEHLLGRTDTKYPPIDFIRTLRELELDGYDDWYLGSKYEMEVIYYNLKPTTDNNTTVADSQDNAYSVPQRTTANYTAGTPSQTSVSAFQSGGAQAFDSETSTAQVYYTSSAPNTNVANAKAFRTSGGLAAGYNYNSGQKYSENGITRAIRRAAYTGSEPSIGAAYLGGYYAGLYSLNGDGTATHALIVSDKANGENTGMRALVQQKFSSGLYWIKDRQASDEHKLIDSVRGLTNQLSSNLTTAETTYSDPDNASVAWNWLAGGTGSSNTAGSITSTVSANPSAGFSIVTWTAPSSSQTNSVGHGLGVAPSFVICKSRSGGVGGLNWSSYHVSLGKDKFINLESTGAAVSVSNYWGANGMTSTTIGLPTGSSSTGYNNNTGNMVAYAFAEIEGYSKFGSYTGNGSTDGPFVYCGFKPAWVMIKRTSSTGSWYIGDNTRNTYNVMNARLLANSSNVESSTLDFWDFTSNGFKLRTSSSEYNSSGQTFVFMAFAENPFGGSGVSPATAR